MKTLQTILEEFMESEPVKRVLAIEDTAIVTGRTGQYHGSTIQDEFRKSLEELLEQVVPEERRDDVNKGGGQYGHPETDFDTGFNACRQEVKERIKKIINN